VAPCLRYFLDSCCSEFPMPSSMLTPTQQAAVDDLVAVVKLGATTLIELRSPPLLGRGHGVTTVLRAAAAALGAPLLGISTSLDSTLQDQANTYPGLLDLQPLRTIRSAACSSLEKH